MECVPPAFLPPFPRVSQASREEKILRRERKHHDTVKLQRGSLLVYHRFGEAVKQVTKSGAILVRDAKEVEHLRVELDKKWGSGRQRGRKNRPSRYRKGISGHNEVREQRLLLVQKIVKLFEKQPMYFMRELEEHMQDQPTWPIRDLVPAVAYYYCNGPWRSRWVRFGYRPEDHPSDRFEQILEFRLFPAQLRVWAAALEQAGVKKSSTPKVFAPVVATASPAAKTASTAAAKAAAATGSAKAAAATGSAKAAAATGPAGAAVREGGRAASVTAPAAAAASSAPKKGSEGHSSSSSSSSGSKSDKAGGAAAGDAKDNNNTENSRVGDEETETDPPFGDAATTGPAATEHASKKSKTGPSGDGATTATADNEGDRVAEAEMEEEEDGAVVGGGGGRQKDTGLTLTSQRFPVGGIVPEVGLTSRPKGRFASQLVLNGNILSARNRHVVGESPFREVQELALKAPRMDRPGIVTGWWQQGTMDKMRMLTLEALSTLVKHKKQEMAAAAAATAAAAAAAAAGDAGASAGDGGKSAEAGAATTGASSCLAAAVVPGQAKKGAMRQQKQQNKATAAGPSAATVRNPLPANMSRDEFRRKTRTIAKDVEVVQAPPPAMSESAMDAGAYGREGDEGRGGGGGGKAFVTSKSATRKIGFAGTGGRSGTGRVAGKSAAGGGGGGGKRPAGAAAGGAGGAAAVPALLREADRAVVQSDTDSDEDSESDSVNSSDLVDDTEDSWDSQQDDTSDGDRVSEISEIFGGESSAAEEDNEAKEKVQEKGKGDKSPRTPPTRGGRVAGRGRGKGASASKRSGGSSRRKRA
ncbi:unnamed protein product [Ectocarpus sp. 12 AP-2014]